MYGEYSFLVYIMARWGHYKFDPPSLLILAA